MSRRLLVKQLVILQAPGNRKEQDRLTKYHERWTDHTAAESIYLWIAYCSWCVFDLSTRETQLVVMRDYPRNAKSHGQLTVALFVGAWVRGTMGEWLELLRNRQSESTTPSTTH